MTQNSRFCPNCGSDWVEPDTSNRAMVFFSGGDPNRWKCNECGYTGLMPQLSEEKACSEQNSGGNLRPRGDPEKDFEPGEELEFEPDEEYPREDTGFGKAYLRYLAYIAVPLLFLYHLYLTLI